MNEYFKLPFKLDYGKVYIKDNNGRTVFDWLVDDDNLKEEIINILNSPEKRKLNKGELYLDTTNQVIILENKPILRVRGWGYLTGCGGCNLRPDQAIKVQDEVINLVIQKLR